MAVGCKQPWMLLCGLKQFVRPARWHGQHVCLAQALGLILSAQTNMSMLAEA